MRISEIRQGDKIWWYEAAIMHAVSDPIFSDGNITAGCKIQYVFSDRMSIWQEGALIVPIENDVDTIHYKINQYEEKENSKTSPHPDYEVNS